MEIEPTKTGDQDRLEELITVGTRLVEEIQAFSRGAGVQFTHLASRARTNRRLIRILAFSVVVNLIFTVAVAVGIVLVVHNDHRISGLTDRLDTLQTVQRQKALCPLYQLFLDQKSAAGRAAAPDKAAYDHAFVVINSGYQVLGCQQYIAGQSGN